MQIRILASGIDTPVVSRTFEFEGCSDRVFVASVGKVKDILGRGMRINLDQTLLLLAFTVANATDMGWGRDKTRKAVSRMLSHDKVMIGVPEMLDRLGFEIAQDGEVTTVSVDAPIAVPNYRLVGSD